MRQDETGLSPRELLFSEKITCSCNFSFPKKPKSLYGQPWAQCVTFRFLKAIKTQFMGFVSSFLRGFFFSLNSGSPGSSGNVLCLWLAALITLTGLLSLPRLLSVLVMWWKANEVVEDGRWEVVDGGWGGGADKVERAGLWSNSLLLSLIHSF